MQFFKIGALVALIMAAPKLALHAAVGHAARRHRDPHVHGGRLNLPADYAAWTRVAGCESGGWQVLGYEYPDSLGIDRTNWLDAGGTPQPPGPVSRTSRIMQIRVADRFIANYHTGIPDQYGCAAW